MRVGQQYTYLVVILFPEANVKKREKEVKLDDLAESVVSKTVCNVSLSDGRSVLLLEGRPGQDTAKHSTHWTVQAGQPYYIINDKIVHFLFLFDIMIIEVKGSRGVE